MNKNKIVFVVLLFAIITLTGCYTFQARQVNKAREQLNAKMNPLIGRSKEDIVLTIGAPNSIEMVGNIEVYRYFQSYGNRGNASAYSSGNYTTAGGQSWEAYDKYTIYFKNGIAVKWDGYVQR
jgi:uncharacterized membrane protein